MKNYQPPRFYATFRQPKRRPPFRARLAMLRWRALRPWRRLRDRWEAAHRKPSPAALWELEMRAMAEEVDRLELAATLGSAEAENRLSDYVENALGRERARLAAIALHAIRSRRN